MTTNPTNLYSYQDSSGKPPLWSGYRDMRYCVVRDPKPDEIDTAEIFRQIAAEREHKESDDGFENDSNRDAD